MLLVCHLNNSRHIDIDIWDLLYTTLLIVLTSQIGHCLAPPVDRVESSGPLVVLWLSPRVSSLAICKGSVRVSPTIPPSISVLIGISEEVVILTRVTANSGLVGAWSALWGRISEPLMTHVLSTRGRVRGESLLESSELAVYEIRLYYKGRKYGTRRHQRSETPPFICLEPETKI